MSVMSIRVDDEKRRLLKAIASLEDKTIGGLVGELIEKYIEKNRQKLEIMGGNTQERAARQKSFRALTLKAKGNSRGKKWKREELYRV